MSSVRAQEKSRPSNENREFTPGETVPISGIYDVLHDKVDGEDHAEQQKIAFLAGSVFPTCKGCREWVRFRLNQAAAAPGSNPHLLV